MAAARRLIAHLDMDAFYASVELLRYAELRGEAVVIGGSRRRHQPRDRASPGEGEGDGRRFEYSRLGSYAGRGVVTTATYEARRFGIRSGLGLMKAAKLAPQAILLPSDFDEYRRCSRLFKAAVAEIAPVIEDRGIDEIYVDLTEVPGAQEAVGHDAFGGARALALEIKNNVKRATGLSCSIGVTPNKLLSKLASELEKPDGLTILTEADLESRIWPLPVRALNGIGPKAGEKLAALGIETIGDIAAQSPAALVERFGRSYGAWLHRASHGVDERPLVTHGDPVSMSRETTFDRDLHAVRDRAELSGIFTALCERVAADLRRKAFLGRTIGIKLRFDDFRTVTRDQTLPLPVDDAAAIRRAAGLCLKRVELTRRLRLLGVRVGNLSKRPAA